MPYDPLACAVICIVLYAISVVSVVLRFYVRFYLLNNTSTDDYLAAGAAIVYTGFSLSYILGVLVYGVGRYSSEVSPGDYENGLKTVFIGELLYFTTNLLVKLSIIFTLSRIVTTPAHRLTLYILAGSGFVVTIFTFFWAVFYCDPVRYFWTQQHDFALGGDGPATGRSVSGSCKPISEVVAVVIVHASWTLLADLTLGLVLPVLILWSSQMRTRVKVSVGVLLGVGSVAAIATIIRIIYLPSISLSESLLTNNPVIFWSIVESAVGIIASAGATWRPLLRGDSLGGSGSGSSGARRYMGSDNGGFSGAGSRISRGRQSYRSGFEGGGGGGGRVKGLVGLRSLTEEEEGILLDGVGVGKGGRIFASQASV
ncbi:hypothetical protein BJX68DRAFT_267154 [Aspergillus pseudodeflectus]|uniref:Rhodopsin domain-containing protein n=1 Tax=Aspergillus pseudodeflectus TaxID=176178 RepID=A0ABR4KBA7_9EURO